MSYRAGIMTNPGEGESSWSPGDAVVTDPGSPDFLDLATFEAMVEAGAIEESEPLDETTFDGEVPGKPKIAALREAYLDLTGEDPSGMKKAELIEALEDIERAKEAGLEASYHADPTG